MAENFIPLFACSCKSRFPVGASVSNDENLAARRDLGD